MWRQVLVWEKKISSSRSQLDPMPEPDVWRQISKLNTLELELEAFMSAHIVWRQIQVFEQKTT